MAKAKTTKAKTTKTKAVKEVAIPETVIPETVVPETVVPETVVPVKPTLATAVTTDAAKPKKVALPKVDIIRGRMPLVLVYSIKFLETGTTNEIATKYRTTVGKVDDIKKGANFGYITDKFIPTMDMVKAAVPRCKELVAGKEILTAVQAIGIATPDDEIAFDAIKAAMRKTTKKPVLAKSADLVNETELLTPVETIAEPVINDKIDPQELINEVEEEDEDLLSLLR